MNAVLLWAIRRPSRPNHPRFCSLEKETKDRSLDFFSNALGLESNQNDKDLSVQ